MGMLSVLSVLGRRYGVLWLEENFELIAVSVEEGNIIWITDDLGISISAEGQYNGK